jgi:flagellar biosynthesis protein
LIGNQTWIFDLANSDNDTNNDNGNDANKKDTIAVALRYDADSEYAPKVVAGGRGSIAEQILEIAFANGIKVREDQDLAEVLSSIDIDSKIPVEAFAAVAEILIYVYRANGGELEILAPEMETETEKENQAPKPGDPAS